MKIMEYINIFIHKLANRSWLPKPFKNSEPSESEAEADPAENIDNDTIIAMSDGENRTSMETIDPIASTIDKPKRPKRKCTEKIKFSADVGHDNTEMDKDYLPSEPPQRRAKPGSSASHSLLMQEHLTKAEIIKHRKLTRTLAQNITLRRLIMTGQNRKNLKQSKALLI